MKTHEKPALFKPAFSETEPAIGLDTNALPSVGKATSTTELTFSAVIILVTPTMGAPSGVAVPSAANAVQEWMSVRAASAEVSGNEIPVSSG